jgi:predicted MFS family arabinose efflux permease
MSISEDRAIQRTIVLPRLRSTQMPAGALVVLLGFSYMFNSMDRQVFPALLTAIIPHYRLTLSQAGLASTIFTVTVAIFGALSGWFMMRFSRKAVLVGGLVAYSVFTLITPLAGGFLSLATFRTLTGAGEALQIGAIYACLGGYFGNRRGTFMGIIQAFFGLGALVGPVLGTRLFAWSDSWQLSFYVFGLAGIVISVAIALAIPKEFSDANEDVTAERSLTVDSSSVLNANVLIATLAFFLMGMTFFAYTSLYATFLHDQLGYSVADAGTALGMYGLGAIGGAYGGRLGDRIGRIGAACAFFVLASTGFLMFHGTVSPVAHAALSLAFGLSISGFLFARLMSMLQLSVQPQKIGQVVSMGLGAFYAPGPIAGYMFGKLVTLVGWPSASLVMVVAPVAVATALICLFNEKKMRAI